MVGLILVGAFTVVMTIFIIRWLQNASIVRKTINQIPGPPCYPLVGNMPSLVCSSEHLWNKFRRWARDYYPIYKIWNFHTGTVALLCPDDIEILLSSKKHLTKSRIYEWMQPWLGTGLLTSTGSKWHSRRKILTPAFHFNILREFVEIFSEQSEILVHKLQEECGKPCTDLVPIITQFTLHSICETAMGTRIDETKKQQREYVTAVYRIGEIIIYRLQRPWLFFNKIYRLVPQYKEMKQLVKILHHFSRSVIEERKNNFKETETSLDIQTQHVRSKRRLAMLDLLISAKNKGVPIDDEGIREEVDTFMFEGHDTTTASICFTLLLLANHSEIQEKVVEELYEVFGNSKEPINYQDLSQLCYLEQVIKESLRMYPSVPLIARRTDEDIRTASGYTIPRNVYVQVQIYDVHHNPEIYPEPYTFDPGRFSIENSQGRHPFAYLPFSAGSRNCIGQKFAMLELKTVISSILRRFVLKPVDTPSDIKMIMHLILKTQGGIKIKFEERHQRQQNGVY